MTADPVTTKARPGNEVRCDECRCGHWRQSHSGWRGCLYCACASFGLPCQWEGCKKVQATWRKLPKLPQGTARVRLCNTHAEEVDHARREGRA